VLEDDVAVDASGTDPAPAVPDGAAVPRAVGSLGRADVQAVADAHDPHDGERGE
jgi:hypothetical protein